MTQTKLKWKRPFNGMILLLVFIVLLLSTICYILYYSAIISKKQFCIEVNLTPFDFVRNNYEYTLATLWIDSTGTYFWKDEQDSVVSQLYKADYQTENDKRTSQNKELHNTLVAYLADGKSLEVNIRGHRKSSVRELIDVLDEIDLVKKNSDEMNRLFKIGSKIKMRPIVVYRIHTWNNSDDSIINAFNILHKK